MVEAYTQLREQERPEVDLNEVDRNPEVGSVTHPVSNYAIRGRAEELSELMAEGLRYGRTTARQRGLYPYDEDTRQSDIPRDDIIAHANEWLVQESKFDYQTLESVMDAAGLQDAVDWAWEQLDGPSYQFNLATFLSGANAFNPVGDVLTGDFEWGRTPDRLKEFRPNPYADQSLGERTGIRNWGDAVYAILDVLDLAALGMGGEVVRPIWNALKKTDDPLRAWGQVVEAYRPPPIHGGVAKTGPLVVSADDLHPYGNTPAWIDAAGNEGPVILHGTPRLDSFDTFEIGSAQRGWGSEGGIRHNAGLRGVYGTTSPEMAQIYVGSGSVIGGPGGRIYNLTYDGTPRVLDLTAGEPMPLDVRELLDTKMRLDPDPSFRSDEMRAMLSDETTPLLDFLQVASDREAFLSAGGMATRDTFEANAVREAITELYDVVKTAPYNPIGELSERVRYTNEESIEWIFLKPENVRVARSTIDPPRSTDWYLQPEARRALEARDVARARVTEEAAARAEMQAAREAGGKPAAPAPTVDDLPVPEEYLGDLRALHEKGTGELIIANPTVGDLVAKADELEGEFWAKIEPGFESSAENIYVSVMDGGSQSIFRELASHLTSGVHIPNIVSGKWTPGLPKQLYDLRAWDAPTRPGLFERQQRLADEAGDDLWEAYVDDFLTRYPDQDPIIVLSQEVKAHGPPGPTGGVVTSPIPAWSHLDAIGQSVQEWLDGYALRKTARTIMEGGK